MILETNNTSLIIVLVVLGICVVIAILAVVKAVLNYKKNDVKTQQGIKNTKLYEHLLDTFFTALGGSDNVLKLQTDEEKNCLVAIVRDVNKTNLCLLSEYNLIKYEIIEQNIELYFEDSKKFYDSLFAK